jgi:tRNA nucleotidyltransferase (CCA-adding enzyme)
MRKAMQKSVNLKEKMEVSLPCGALDFIARAAETAGALNVRLYLVGGAVRDILLGKKSFDIDLTVEGDAVALAKKLAEAESRVELHPQFGTAKLEISKDMNIDITSARKELYSRPGALPAVSPGSLKDDLFRRDFTVNAMAVALDPAHYGKLIDLYGGLADLSQKFIRVLHDKSFTDDATRIWRAIRYGERLGFAIEAHTLTLLERDIDCLDTITGDRIRYELERVFGEDNPEKVLCRASELGVLAKLCPDLKGGGDLAERFERARGAYPRRRPPFALYTALLTYPLNEEKIERFIAYLKLDKKTARVLRDADVLRRKANALGDTTLSPSGVFHLLSGCDPLAIQALYIESDDATVRRRIELFDIVLRKMKLFLTGDDLKRLGVPEGPEMKKALEMLLDARLNGETIDREGEERVVREWMKEKE